MAEILQSRNFRDYDIDIARRTAAVVNSGDDHFVLTGSYSIEVLTRGVVSHNDIDVNVFTRDIPRSIARVGLILAHTEAPSHVTRIENTKPNRLEYSVATNVGERDLELQFVEFDEAIQQPNGLDFKIASSETRDIVVPTVLGSLDTSNGELVDFRVKSLPFAIATWALRISGVAEAQKRPVRQSDIDHFAFLVQAPHDTDKVIQAMLHHPQMSSNASAEEVLSVARNYVGKS